MRLRNIKNSKELLLASDFTLQQFPYIITANTVIEMGMGKAEMLVQLAEQNRHLEFIGIEKYPTVAYKSLKKAAAKELKNFKIINLDIKDLPGKLLGKTDLIWLTFSDPWPKKRHHKRRLTYKSFLKIYKELLSENGVLKMKTDNDDLFAYSIESLKSFGAEIIHLTDDLHNSQWAVGNIMTGYEKKWTERGKKINYLAAKFY
ncbi:tRNA (guanosine(46)-N7)-methyltransferase TrmB [Mycoplasma iguanae]|uniref:tRNA (guanine-N(7)-)-methyltransferase n=1 Tax=Mycoplasma iguanae TaxID=292461 RepID=A0ABY5R7R2_9MOLU|nr:tRNA (guanosine(46)-N7)-methyltransferase TrmB [Mycoplasma iguanae]UVD81548.1 tRNA (guanosine(46)-N7)-methyltransferase TrmB [Mycoplasma iguanae]